MLHTTNFSFLRPKRVLRVEESHPCQTSPCWCPPLLYILYVTIVYKTLLQIAHIKLTGNMAASRLVSFAEKIIKPCSPTPLSLRHYNLSLIDQFMLPVYMPIVAFYPFPSKNPQQISNILEKSLSKVLSSYFPFAGRLRDNTFVDCNDRGAKFMNVEYDCPMSKVVNLPDTGPEYLPFPKDLPWTRTRDEESLLVIQLSHFNCGGLAISASISHKIADGCTLCNLISDWAAISRDETAKVPSPQMIGSSIFSPSTDIHTDTMIDEIDNQSLSRKRYLFSNSKLKLLKSQVASETGVQNPTRLEVLSALIYKCATSAARANSSSSKPSVLTQVVNLRPIFDPPLPTRAIGNIFSIIPVATMSEDEISIARVVCKLRKAKEELKNEDHVKENKLVSLMSKWPSMANEIELYRSSSVCNYPLNNLDFGWGRPSRVTIPVIGLGNTFFLMDNQSGDGIEAIVSLPEKDVPEFEKSKELIEFASPITDLN
ncbi:acylsugar acyltransferase 3-like [Lycium barbarum]|uniref:acylsugar acyltransferase 3-like n=1 Tax=Lycium barbarum TaxID=112863 RepID=UPI00293EB80E|nr:acylsugar acyltransferase 3-like [Lycium barbarum]